MGYTIYIIAKDVQSRDRMVSFLEKNMLNFDYSRLAYGNDTGGLSYVGKPHKKNELIIGFDYNSGAEERYYLYRLLKWIGNKIAKKPEVYYYDGEKSYWEDKDKFALGPENTEMNVEDKRATACVNFYLNRSLPTDELDRQIKAILDPIYDNIKTLEKLWTE